MAIVTAQKCMPFTLGAGVALKRPRRASSILGSARGGESKASCSRRCSDLASTYSTLGGLVLSKASTCVCVCVCVYARAFVRLISVTIHQR
eukprot:1160271-Pelagomonas_calceolata.AAC.10